jgi:hypothetical protein
VALSDLSISESRLRRRSELKQSQRVGDRDAAATQPLSDLLMAQALLISQVAQSLGRLEGIEVLALNVLDQRPGELLSAICISHQSGHTIQTSRESCPPPAFPRHELVTGRRRPQQQGLQEPVLTHALDQLLQVSVGDRLARLSGVGADHAHVDLAQTGPTESRCARR